MPATSLNLFKYRMVELCIRCYRLSGAGFKWLVRATVTIAYDGYRKRRVPEEESVSERWPVSSIARRLLLWLPGQHDWSQLPEKYAALSIDLLLRVYLTAPSTAH